MNYNIKLEFNDIFFKCKQTVNKYEKCFGFADMLLYFQSVISVSDVFLQNMIFLDKSQVPIDL